MLILAAVHFTVWLAFGFWLIPTASHIYSDLPMDVPWVSRVVLRVGWIDCARFALAGAVLIGMAGYFKYPRWVRVMLTAAVAVMPICAGAALLLPLVLHVDALAH
jgi:type II secretory pathway component PulF